MEEGAESPGHVESLIDRAVAGDHGASADVDERFARARADSDAATVDAILGALAIRAAGGSSAALDTLLTYISRHRLAHAAIYRVVVDPSDVDDAVQETLLAVTKGIGTFQGRARFTTWLFTVAQHASLLVVRRKARGGLPTENLPELAAQPGGVRRMSSLVATRQVIEDALRGLPPHYRDPLVLREIEQRSYEEIAERLQLPMGTVRSRISRARRMVADLLRA